MIIKGTDPDFKIVFIASKQKYVVYKNDKYLITGYRFRDIQSYL